MSKEIYTVYQPGIKRYSYRTKNSQSMIKFLKRIFKLENKNTDNDIKEAEDEWFVKEKNFSMEFDDSFIDILIKRCSDRFKINKESRKIEFIPILDDPLPEPWYYHADSYISRIMDCNYLSYNHILRDGYDYLQEILINGFCDADDDSLARLLSEISSKIKNISNLDYENSHDNDLYWINDIDIFKAYINTKLIAQGDIFGTFFKANCDYCNFIRIGQIVFVIGHEYKELGPEKYSILFIDNNDFLNKKLDIKGILNNSVILYNDGLFRDGIDREKWAPIICKKIRDLIITIEDELNKLNEKSERETA